MTATVARPTLLSYRSLIWNFAQRDLKARFKSTALGWGWSLLLPLASLGTYTLISRVIFRSAAPALGGGHKGIFAAYLFLGLATWNFFQAGVNTTIGGLLGTGGLLRKIYFPSYTPVLGSMVAVGVQSMIELGLALAVMVAFLNVGISWLLIPLWAVLFFLFTTGLSLMLSIANIYFRDLAHIVAVILGLLFYATPIIYPPTQIPTKLHYGINLRAVIQANPLSQFVELFRDNAYKLQAGPWTSWAQVTVWALVMLGLGILTYRRVGQDLGELV